MGTKSRRAAREFALNVLYQVDVAKLPPEEALETALEYTRLEEATAEFATALVRGTLEHIRSIDETIGRLSVGWDTQRQPAVDRNILRMAMYEMLHLDNIPYSVTINEAVELAKKFSTEESGRFVNGVLGALARECGLHEEERYGAEMLDGLATARQIREEIKAEVERFIAQTGVTPHLAVIIVGEDPASQVYVNMKKKACLAAGMLSTVHELPENSAQEEIIEIIRQLNADPGVHGIMVQHPVPKHLDELEILAAVAREKDVDGISRESLGSLVTGNPLFIAATPAGIIELLDRYNIPIEGKHAVVVGRSLILGKPVALYLLNRHATVTICHTRTRDLAAMTRQADILVAAAGKPEMITGDMLKEGVVVIDAGYNKVEGRDKDIGDVEFESAAQKASWITPVPGGVGPMTIAMLLKNTLKAASLP
ncbi:MAG TPA: bifunctional methylenetetrahydrofolate dehydrogenase/methenyltetrahydrofolate cyclohydrolase FolD [Armatimonadota bacterium]|nr:bifunctional methylenetetrahydrofolate dehydrogenase/methenyltetrahydrofolate cyclohydrolase FolD [Armatimonadota bacterium]